MHSQHAPSRLTALLCFLAITIPASGVRAAPAGVPTLVQRAAAAYSTDVRGTVGMQRHFSTTIKAGPVRHTETSESGILFSNGAFVKIKYYRLVQDGKTFSSDKLQARETQTNSDWAAGKIFYVSMAKRVVVNGVPRRAVALGYSPDGATLWAVDKGEQVTALPAL